jgi:Tfp pilus assembly protein PilZ
VLAEPDRVDGPLELVARGINRVMLNTDPPELIGQQAALLMNIAPRATLRLSTRMLVEVADGCEEALGAVVNISKTGLLAETDTDFEPGQHIVLTISLLDDSEPLTVKAEVVRRAHPERDGVEGIGARFLSFADDSQQRLEAILGKAFETPIP